MTQTRPSPGRRIPRVLLGVVLALGPAVLGAAAPAWAWDNCHCPPYYVHCTERPPKICFKCVCPKPVCVPCDQPFWGYYPTCWRRWPAPYANCPDRDPPWVCVPPPCTGPGCPGPLGPGPVAALPGAPASPRGGAEGTMPGAGQPGTLPAPKKSTDELPPLAPGAKPGARLPQAGPDQAAVNVPAQVSSAAADEPATLFIATPGAAPTR